MDSDTLILTLTESDPGDIDALYDEAWTLITQTIRKNTKHKSARTILSDYLDDTREDGGGSNRRLEFVFLSPSSACDVQMAVTAHWFTLAVALAAKELQALCKKHGYRMKAPKKTALALAKEKRKMPFVPHGEEIIGVVGAQILTDGGGEQTFEEAELSRATAALATKAAKSGRCLCALCETIRAGKTSVAKVQAKPIAPEPPPAPDGVLVTFTSLARALKKPLTCGRLDLSKVNEYRSAKIHWTELPESIRALTNVTEIDTSGTVTKSLPKALFKLTKLERLRLGWVDSLGKDGALPDAIGALSRLVELRIGGVKVLPNSLERLTALETLHLGFAGERVPELILTLSQLKHLTLRTDAALPNLGKLTALRSLMVRGGKGADKSTDLSQLTELTELFWEGLTQYPSSLRDLPKLRRLAFGKSRIPALPRELRTLKALEEIEIEYASFTAWPDVLDDLPALKVITFTNAGKLTSLDALHSLPAVETLRLTDSELTQLPRTAPSLPALKTLDIRHSRKLTALPDWIVKLPKLERICLALAPLSAEILAGLKQARPELNVDLYI